MARRITTISLSEPRRVPLCFGSKRQFGHRWIRQLPTTLDFLCLGSQGLRHTYQSTPTLGLYSVAAQIDALGVESSVLA
jgi:hypothetical protein